MVISKGDPSESICCVSMRKAVLESLGFAVVEGVRMGDAPSGWNYGVL